MLNRRYYGRMATSFLTTRLSGEAPLETVFWRDMLLVGSLVNIAATALALALLAADYPPLPALAINFAPIPYNLFLVLACWRSAAREGGPPATTATIVSTLWFAVMMVL